MISPEQDAPTDFAPNNFLISFFRTAKAVLFSPRLFYERMKTDGGLRNPFLFLICCVLIHTLGASLYVKNQTIIALNVVNGIVMPFVTAGILFMIITRLFKASGSYEMSFRVCAYAAATALFSWIGYVGLFVEFYRLYLIGLGLSRTFSVRVFQTVLALVLTVMIYGAVYSPIIKHIVGSQTPSISP
jgi:hypothetical protein